MQKKEKDYVTPNVLVIFKNKKESIVKSYKRYFSLMQLVTEVRFTILETEMANMDDIFTNKDVKSGWNMYQEIMNNIEKNKGKSEFDIKVSFDKFLFNFRYTFILIIECDKEKELQIISSADKSTNDILNISIIDIDNIPEIIKYI